MLPETILAAAERGCPSRSTVGGPGTVGISQVHPAIQTAAGGTPAVRSNWVTHPQVAPRTVHRWFAGRRSRQKSGRWAARVKVILLSHV